MKIQYQCISLLGVILQHLTFAIKLDQHKCSRLPFEAKMHGIWTIVVILCNLQSFLTIIYRRNATGANLKADLSNYR